MEEEQRKMSRTKRDEFITEEDLYLLAARHRNNSA